MSKLKAFIGGILDIEKHLVIKFRFLWRLFSGLPPFPLFLFFLNQKECNLMSKRTLMYGIPAA